MEAGQSRLVRGRDIGGGFDALAVDDGIGADVTGAHLLDRVRGLVDDEVDLARNEIVHRRPRATVRHILQLDAGSGLEGQPRDMAARSRTRRSGGSRCRSRFQPVQKFLQRLCRHRILADDDHGVARQQRHRLEVGDEVVAELVDRAVGDMGAEMPERDGVTVGGRFCRAADADRTARPRHVLDQHGLVERDLRPLGEDPRHGVGGPAGGERHDDGDGTRGEVLGGCWVEGQCRKQSGQDESSHVLLQRSISNPHGEEREARLEP